MPGTDKSSSFFCVGALKSKRVSKFSLSALAASIYPTVKISLFLSPPLSPPLPLYPSLSPPLSLSPVSFSLAPSLSFSLPPALFLFLSSLSTHVLINVLYFAPIISNAFDKVDSQLVMVSRSEYLGGTYFNIYEGRIIYNVPMGRGVCGLNPEAMGS